MKRFMGMFLAVLMALSLTACGQAGNASETAAPAETNAASAATEETITEGTATEEVTTEETTTEETTTEEATTEEATTAQTAAETGTETAAETQSDMAAQQDAGSDAQSNVLVAFFSWSGNTEEMASYIAEQTGGDLLEIQPETPYPTDYNECGDVALAERDENARPTIANLPESLEGYDTIIIGYPIWWHTAPMIIGTFLESYDLTGMEIYPFTQSASMDTEQFDNSIAFVRENAANATVHDGLFAEHTDTEAIDAYLSENGLVG